MYSFGSLPVPMQKVAWLFVNFTQMVKINTIFLTFVRYEKQGLSSENRLEITSFRVSHKSSHKHVAVFKILNLLNYV